MPNLVVVGMQWGDEGKGKVVDLLCPAFDLVARYQGGNNAGHTVKFGDQHFALHLVPSGVLHDDKVCVLGNGMVIDPQALLDELEYLCEMGIDVAGRIRVSDRAQLILPPYRRLDCAREAALGRKKIGTTAKGIGPAYELKASRQGLRVCDLWSQDLDGKLERLAFRISGELERLGDSDPIDLHALTADCREWARQLEPMVSDTQSFLNEAVDGGSWVLLEGAQGTLLDLDHGTYPYVTSSNSTAGGAAVGSGLPASRINGVFGVVKAYTSRVGEGPFPSEEQGKPGEFLRERGQEFGTTTGRPRRCGWFDVVACRYARRISGIESLALTKLDVLDDLDEIPVCVGYRLDGQELQAPPALVELYDRVEPVYETLPGWNSSTVGCTTLDELPANARTYVEFLEQQVGATVGLVSTGPRREETVVPDGSVLAGWLEGRFERLGSS